MSHQHSIVVFNADTLQGEAIIRDLLDENHRHHVGKQFQHVFATVRDTAHSGDLLALGVCLVEMGDSPDESKLAQCLKQWNAKTVVLPPDYGSKNVVLQSKRIINACKNGGVERFIFLSLVGADDTSVEWAKYCNEIEQYLKQIGLNMSAIVRHAPLQQFLFLYRKMFFEHNTLRWPCQEDARFTFVSLRDISSFVVHELLQTELSRHKEPQMFKLTGPAIHTPKELCQILSKVMGRTIQFQQVERQEFQNYLQKEGGLHEMAAKEIVDMHELISRGRMNFVSEDQKKSTGKEPLKLEQWIEKHKSLFGSRSPQGPRHV